MYVYTDGSCVNNGKPNAKAGMGIYFGENDSRNVSKMVRGDKHSNNTAELGAFLEVYDILSDYIDRGGELTIVSDSVYAIRCVGEYGKKCAASNWVKDIPNKSLVRRAYELFQDAPNVRFKYIAAHTGKQDEHSVGNDHADRLANEAIGVTPTKKIYLNVPYAHKDDAKKHGAKWDAKKKKWFTHDMVPELEVYTVV